MLENLMVVPEMHFPSFWFMVKTFILIWITFSKCWNDINSIGSPDVTVSSAEFYGSRSMFPHVFIGCNPHLNDVHLKVSFRFLGSEIFSAHWMLNKVKFMQRDEFDVHVINIYQHFQDFVHSAHTHRYRPDTERRIVLAVMDSHFLIKCWHRLDNIPMVELINTSKCMTSHEIIEYMSHSKTTIAINFYYDRIFHPSSFQKWAFILAIWSSTTIQCTWKCRNGEKNVTRTVIPQFQLQSIRIKIEIRCSPLCWFHWTHANQFRTTKLINNWTMW